MRPSWGHLGASWGHLGAILRSFVAILGYLGTTSGHLGASWGFWGALGAVLGPSWGFFGRSWGHLANLGHLGAILGPFWAILGPQDAPTSGARAATLRKQPNLPHVLGVVWLEILHVLVGKGRSWRERLDSEEGGWVATPSKDLVGCSFGTLGEGTGVGLNHTSLTRWAILGHLGPAWV